jgi:hypothetical protein
VMINVLLNKVNLVKRDISILHVV